MNGEPLDIGHGAPLRLRAETQLGYKMVKWIRSIEFVYDYKNIGMAREDTEKIICTIVLVLKYDTNNHIILKINK